MLDIDIIKDILTSFGQHLVPDMEDDELESAIEEYMESDAVLQYIETPPSED